MQAEFQNLKISITDEVHLKAVCDVLESMGYKYISKRSQSNYVYTFIDGTYLVDMNWQPAFSGIPYSTLTDLLKMRDKAFKDGLK